MPINTPSSWLNHKFLAVIKGIGKTAGDSNSAENDPVVINLLSGVYTLAQDGWSPSIPATKGGGVWADSPISDGRTLLSASVGNVTESMVINITAGGYLETMQALSALNKMVADCRDFWQTEAQIDPVYLAWWAGCGAGLQYALIYNIEMKPEYVDSPNPTIRVTLSIEREQYWRMGVPPGANPKIWTYDINSSNAQFNVNTASLITGSDHLITQVVQNKFEWTPASFGLQTAPLSQNYIDVGASQVAGDAPALVNITIGVDTSVPANIYIARSSKKYSGTGHDGVTRYSSLILNTGDSATGAIVKTVGTSNTGSLSNNSSVNYYYGTRTSTGIDGGWTTLCRWGDSTANGIKLDREMYRGTFAVFCRCCNNSAAPVITDMRARLLFEEYESSAANEYINSVILPEIQVPFTGGGSNRPLTYMGSVTLPLASRTVQSPLGYGIQLQESSSNLRITVQHQVDVATANRTVEIQDLIFIPIDECMAKIALSLNTYSSIGTPIIDSTGYLSRGALGQFGIGYITNANSGGVNQQVLGADLTLLPHTNQRLYFIADSWVAGNTSPIGRPQQILTVRVNIVPRCSGVRAE